MKPSHGDIFVVVRTGVVEGSFVVAEVGKVLDVEDSVEEGIVEEDVVEEDVVDEKVADEETVEEDAVEEDIFEVDVVDEDDAVEDDVDQDDVAKVGVAVASVVNFEVAAFAVVKEAPVDTSSCSAVPLVLLLKKIGTLKIEQSDPSKTASVRKSNNFRDLLNIVF